MNLSDFLNTVSVFEVVDYSRTDKTEICLGRVRADSDGRSEDAWFNMIARTYLAQDRDRVDAVSFSKQYLLKDDALVYLWKVVSKDTHWLSENMPRLDKTLEWQREAVNEVGLREGKNGEIWGRASLPGVKDKLEIGPQPEDIGQISDAKSENL